MDKVKMKTTMKVWGFSALGIALTLIMITLGNGVLTSGVNSIPVTLGVLGFASVFFGGCLATFYHALTGDSLEYQEECRRGLIAHIGIELIVAANEEGISDEERKERKEAVDKYVAANLNSSGELV